MVRYRFTAALLALCLSLLPQCIGATLTAATSADIAAGTATPDDGTTTTAAPGTTSPRTPATTTQSTLSGPQVAMYYGTGNSQGKDPELSTLCQSNEVGIIILSFASSIGSHTRNQDGYPELQINGCKPSNDTRNPYLPDCTALGQTIASCQKAGKKVVLSLGGGGAAVGFQDNAEGAAYATLMWNLFLGGQSEVRPFGVTLDGIDLDIEGGNSTGYAAFANALRKLMDADASRHYLITAAPQCIFPDEWMGPGPGTALTDALTAFDYLFVQFYNNDCRFAAPDRFEQTWQQWTTLGAKQPTILVGLPGAVDAADAASFVDGTDLPKITAKVGADAHFGGLMFWDAGYDADRIAAGQTPMRTLAKQALGALPAAKLSSFFTQMGAAPAPARGGRRLAR